MSCFRPFIVAIAITLFVGAPTANAQRRSGGSVRGGSSAPRVSGGARVTGGGGRIVGGGRVFGAPARYYQPYYMFRPRVSVGLGLWAGFAIGYPYYYGSYYPYPYYSYPYPYAYSYPYPYASAYPTPAYGYPPTAGGYSSTPGYPTSSPPTAPSASIGIQRGSANAMTGGISFEITPATAGIYVDGAYVGTVGQFTPTSQPLALSPGRHHVEIRAPGYQIAAFDEDIVAGQVIPYQGTLQQQ